MISTLAQLVSASRSAPAVFLALAERERGRARFFVSYATIFKLTGIRDKRTVKGALSALHAAEWVKRERKCRRGHDGKWIRNKNGLRLRFTRVQITKFASEGTKNVPSFVHREVGKVCTTTEGTKNAPLYVVESEQTQSDAAAMAAASFPSVAEIASDELKHELKDLPLTADDMIELNEAIHLEIKPGSFNWSIAFQNQQNRTFDLREDLEKAVGKDECGRVCQSLYNKWLGKSFCGDLVAYFMIGIETRNAIPKVESNATA